MYLTFMKIQIYNPTNEVDLYILSNHLNVLWQSTAYLNMRWLVVLKVMHIRY